MEGVKEQAGIDLISKETLEHGHCYLGLCPTVDTALIPLLSHPVLRTKPNACYMYVRIKFHTYRDIISE